MGRKKTAGLYKRGPEKIWHIDKHIEGVRLCQSTGTSNLEEAEKYLAKRKEEIRNAKIYGVRPKRAFSEAAARFLLEKKDKRSIECDIGHLDTLMPYIGHLLLEQITMITLKPFIDARAAEGVKKKTIKLALEVVRSILNIASEEWFDEYGLTWLAKAPKIKMPKVDDARPPYSLSWKEQEILFPLLPAYLSDMALFKVNTGTREQEVCGLRWEYEIFISELDVSIFLIPGDEVKNTLPRIVVLNSIAKSIIEKWRGIHADYVFVCEGKRLSRLNNRSWRKARIVTGIDVTIHDLKHTYGTRLRAAGVSDRDMKDLLGHKSSKDITHHYTPAQIGNLIEASEKVVTNRKETPTLTVIRARGEKTKRENDSRKSTARKIA